MSVVVEQRFQFAGRNGIHPIDMQWRWRVVWGLVNRRGRRQAEILVLVVVCGTRELDQTRRRQDLMRRQRSTESDQKIAPYMRCSDRRFLGGPATGITGPRNQLLKGI